MKSISDNITLPEVPFTKLTALVVDDHPMFLKSVGDMLSAIPQFKTVVRAGNGKQAIDAVSQSNSLFNLVILDLDLPDVSGLEILQRILIDPKKQRVVVITSHHLSHFVTRSLDHGARGYLRKDADEEEIMLCVKEVLKGNLYVPEPIMNKVGRDMVFKTVQKPNGTSTLEVANLTDSEKEVLRLMCQGFTQAEVSDRMSSSKRSPLTVKTHYENIKKKLKITRFAAIMDYAIKTGIHKID